MADETMSAEQAPRGGADQQKPQTEQLRLATAGGFVGQNSTEVSPENFIANQLDARLGVGATAERPPVPPPPPTLTPSPEGNRKHGWRNILIGSSAAVAGGLAIAGALIGLDKGGSQKQNPDTGSNSGVPGLVTTVPTETPTVEVAPTPSPTEIPLIDKLGYVIANENTLGNIGVGVSEEVTHPVECQKSATITITCPGIEQIYHDETADPDGLNAKQFELDVRYKAYMARNPDISMSEDEFAKELEDPNSNLTVSVRGFEGASSLPTNFTFNLKNKIHYIYKPFSDGGLYTLDINSKFNIRMFKGELYLEMSDFSQGGLAPELQYPGYEYNPDQYDIAGQMAAVSAIFIDPKAQTAHNIVAELGASSISPLIKGLLKVLVKGTSNAIYKGKIAE